MLSPAFPARSTDWPLGSRVKWGLDCVCTSNAGVPLTKVSVKVSPETAADVIAGGLLAALDVADQSEDADPELVQLAVPAGAELCAVGLGEDFAAGWELQPQVSARIAAPSALRPGVHTRLQSVTMPLLLHLSSHAPPLPHYLALRQVVRPCQSSSRAGACGLADKG
jgi:hypothetical protein